jgi:AmmeMemoRadiSam system protein B
MNPISEVRPSPIAGSWYSADPHKLETTIKGYLSRAKLPELKGEVVGVISPHAGYIYSGPTASHAFRTVEGKSYDVVAVLSPMHQFHFAPLLTSAHCAYATPLGEISIDTEVLNAFEKELSEVSLELTPVPYDKEHSLEIELPFLQCTLKGTFKLLPIMLRSQEEHIVEKVGHALAAVLKDRKCLLVASTDLSHFYSQEEAERLDFEMLKQIGNFTPHGVLQAEETGRGYACGAGAVAAVLWAAKDLGARSVEVVNHSTSADQTGDTTSVVGYGAAVILK